MKNTILVFLIAVFLVSCSPSTATITATPLILSPQPTLIPTQTLTPSPTKTPLPTSTHTPTPIFTPTAVTIIDQDVLAQTLPLTPAKESGDYSLLCIGGESNYDGIYSYGDNLVSAGTFYCSTMWGTIEIAMGIYDTKNRYLYVPGFVGPLGPFDPILDYKNKIGAAAERLLALVLLHQDNIPENTNPFSGMTLVTVVGLPNDKNAKYPATINMGAIAERISLENTGLLDYIIQNGMNPPNKPIFSLEILTR